MFQRVSSDLVLVRLKEALASETPPPGLRINPGEAFPPTHPTTRLCLELLREALEGGSVDCLVDVGCGCGILGLAAAALGVPRVAGMDQQWEAAATTRGNAQENALAGALLIIQGSTECLRVRFDLVMANLPWEVQMDKAPELDRLAAPGGFLILSGFRDHQESPLLEKYAKLGWSLHRRRVKYFRHPELPPDISFNWVAWLLTR
jgi:ribosomal protein L11 methyltransferase